MLFPERNHQASVHEAAACPPAGQESERALRAATGYRKDVDGLRALAIVPVILFHAGVSAFSGGFVGVDVFFVISGYLITSVIAREIVTGDFSIARFYVRRARRILPALVTVSVVTLIAGLVLLGPTEFRDLGASSVATALSASNILFWRQTNYFAGPADVKPLLMTWSLGVEEQFYLLWPLTLLLAVRRRISPLALLGVLAATSFAISWWGVLHQPAGAFYLLPPRGWELAIGAALAIATSAESTPRRAIVRDASSVLGLVLIGLAVLTFDARTVFPGPAALLPCVGTALLLWAGEGSLANRALLSARPLVFIGLLSYSLYLWHWPMLAFLRILHHERLPTPHAAGAVAAAFVAAYLSWKFVEQPLRRPSSVAPARTLLRYGFVTVFVATLGGIVWMGRGFPSRVPVGVTRAESTRDDWGLYHPQECDRSPTGALPNPACMSGPNGNGQVVALWGDSHADAIAPAVQAWAKRERRGFALMQYSACPPLPDATAIAAGVESPRCTTFSASALEAVARDPRIGVVVLAGRWATYTETTTVENGPSYFLVDGVSRERSQENSRRVFVSALRYVSDEVLSAGKELVIIGPVPEVGRGVIDCVVRRAMPFGEPDDCSISSLEVIHRQQYATQVIQELARSHPAIRTFFPTPPLCEGATCITSQEDYPFYVDDNHLSRYGAMFLVESMSRGLAARRSGH